MKLTILKVANAIPCGPKTEHVFQESEYDIEEHDNFKIKIKHKRTQVEVNTSYFNAVYWKYMQSEESDGSGATKQPNKRSNKA